MLPINIKQATKTKIEDEALLKKMKNAKKPAKKSTKSILDFIENIRKDLNEHLGQYESKFQVIKDYDTLVKYIEDANKYGKIAIDTETTGLNPLVDKIVGLCLYFPGQKATYVPINHVDYITNERLEAQCTVEEVRLALEKLTAKIIMHNAQFDIRVLKNCVGIKVTCWWDTLTAATLLDENEQHGLKYLHSKYISHVTEKSFADYFDEVRFTNIPIEYAYLYAANDALDTFDLYEFQVKYLNDDSNNRQDRLDLNWLYRNIEIPMIDVIVELEDNGVFVDTDYLQFLHEKYHKKLKEAENKCYEEIDKFKDKIDKFRAEHTNCKLDTPINIGSSTQLAILFYDILNAKPIEGKKERSVDKDVMKEFAKQYEIAKSIVDYRAAQKLTSTYIDNIPNIILKDQRVHTHFNALGAKTGRMSSSEPLNLQNIPSHNEDIRKMFIGQTTYRSVEPENNTFILNKDEEVEMQDGTWVWVENLQPGDILAEGEIVKTIDVQDFKVIISVY